jgi:Flp pilus assembly protein TadB
MNDDVQKVADRAMQLANAYLDANSKELARLSGGSMEVLRDAARLVQDRQSHTERGSAMSAEHLAFTLITAAYDSLRRERNPEGNR